MAKIKVYGRVSFPQVFEAKAMQNPDGSMGAKRFGITVLIPKGDKQLRRLEQTRDMVAEDKWGAKAAALLPQLIAAEKTFLRDGDAKDYTGYEDHMYVAAYNKVRPLVIDADKSRLGPEDGKPYGGCYCWVMLDIYAMVHPVGGKQVNASVTGVQFVKDGEAFGGGRAADEDEFDDVAVPQEEDDEPRDGRQPHPDDEEDIDRETRVYRETSQHQRAQARGDEPRVPASRQTMGRPKQDPPSRPGNRRPVDERDLESEGEREALRQGERQPTRSGTRRLV